MEISTYHICRWVFVTLAETFEKKLRMTLLDFIRSKICKFNPACHFATGGVQLCWILKIFLTKVAATGGVYKMCSLECSFLRQSPFYNKVADVQTATLLKKKTVAQVFSCGFCGIFRNIFYRRLASNCFCVRVNLTKII